MRWIAYDAVLKRPGCPILQAVFGGENLLPHRFPPETWLLHPTPGLRVYKVTDDELLQLERITQDAHDRQANNPSDVSSSP